MSTQTSKTNFSQMTSKVLLLLARKQIYTGTAKKMSIYDHIHFLHMATVKPIKNNYALNEVRCITLGALGSINSCCS